MFSEKLQPLVDVASRANDLFNAEHQESSTVVGVTNESLRSMGDDSDTVSIECNHSKQRLMFIMKDSIPGKVGIGVGTPGGDDLEFLGEAELSALDASEILAMMNKYFARHPVQ